MTELVACVLLLAALLAWPTRPRRLVVPSLVPPHVVREGQRP